MAKVSIILPVYNMGQYLAKSLDSLINQSLKDIEIICINDGSTDNSLNILEEYAQKDERVKVINKQNEGQGVARNLGISIACGEFIGFVDPDDWVELDMYEKMYNQAKNLNSEIVICDYIKLQQWNNKIVQPRTFLKVLSRVKSRFVELVSGRNIDKKIINSTLLISPCYSVNKIYKKDFLLLNDIKFSNKRCYEDCIFILKSHILAEKISYINEPFYIYRIHKKSTCRDYEDRYLDLLDTFEDLKKYLVDVNLFEKFELNYDHFVIVNIVWTVIGLKKITNKNKLMKVAKSNLNENNYKLLKKQLFKVYLQKIFCVTNKNEMKFLTILGCEFEIRNSNLNKPVDLVYCWVDGNDVEWQEEKLYWQKKLGIETVDVINPCRFSNNEELRYSLRSVTQNLPWINRIFIITNGQVPKWLDTTHSKIQIINQKDIMPADALPTFNSEAIETCIVNIPDLSEYFLYANDDMFIKKYLSKSYFFNKTGKPIIRLEKRPKKKELLETKLYLKNLVYSANLIYEKFGKNYKYQASHNIDSYTKSSFIECKKVFENEFNETSYKKFRSSNSIQRMGVYFYMLANNLCKFRVLKTHSRKSKLENICVDLQSPDIMDKEIKRHGDKLKLFCINDNELTKDEDRRTLKPYLETLYPTKADWEKDEV